MNQTRGPLQPCEVAGRATAESGVVLLDGPDGVAVAMTAQCALQTAESLRKAAMEADPNAILPTSNPS